MPNFVDNQGTVIAKLRGAAKDYDDGAPIRRYQAEPQVPEVSIADILKAIDASSHATHEESMQALAQLVVHSKALVQIVAAQQQAMQEMVKALNAPKDTGRTFAFEHERDDSGKIQRTVVTMG